MSGVISEIPVLVVPSIIFTVARYYADSVRATIALHVLYNFAVWAAVLLTVVLPHSRNKGDIFFHPL
jgi:membrane protease YdiL (CAAX protease family)